LTNERYSPETPGLLPRICESQRVPEFNPVRKSIRIHGHSTTIRLEKCFWRVLETLAVHEGRTIPELVTTIHDHCPVDERKNLASCLRVVCLQFVSYPTAGQTG